MKAIVRVYDDLDFDILMLMECDKYEIDRAEQTVKESIDCCIRQWGYNKDAIVGLLFMDTDLSFVRMELWTERHGDSWECIMFNEMFSEQIYALCGLG